MTRKVVPANPANTVDCAAAIACRCATMASALPSCPSAGALSRSWTMTRTDPSLRALQYSFSGTADVGSLSAVEPRAKAAKRSAKIFPFGRARKPVAFLPSSCSTVCRSPLRLTRLRRGLRGRRGARGLSGTLTQRCSHPCSPGPGRDAGSCRRGDPRGPDP